MHNGWYTHLIGSKGDFDEGLYENGFLEIAFLSFNRHLNDGRFLFFIDLAGHIEQNSVISSQEGGASFTTGDTERVLRHPDAYQQCWNRLADSFTSWLEYATATDGTFDYRKVPS